MKNILSCFAGLLLLMSCSREDSSEPLPQLDNPELELSIPAGFPAFNRGVKLNMPSKYGVALGELLFHENKLSGNNTISCASCHNRTQAFADNVPQAVGIYGRVGLRNTPAIQNLAFLNFYNWDGNVLLLEKQPLVPIITHEEMNSSIVEVMAKLKDVPAYRELLLKAFGDEQLTADRIYRSLAQYMYSLISVDSKYDQVMEEKGAQFSESEARGHSVFKSKCATCHSGALFTDQSFRNIGFPLNPSSEEAGRGRVTGIPSDYMRFRVPSLRNVAYTAPYGSFGQFKSLMELLDYMDKGVLSADNLDSIFQDNGNRLPLSEQEKSDIIAFLHTLSDQGFVGER